MTNCQNLYLTTLIKGLSVIMSIFLSAHSYSQNLAERLGYQSNDKLLIIHNDDIGLSQSENAASYHSMTKGIVNSGAVMMPCAWAYEAIQLFKDTKSDLGVHLTLTAEWKNYKWAPVSGSSTAPSLTDDFGFMHATVEAVAKNARIDEVENELKSQIELAYKMGLDITHLDTHMGSMQARPDLIDLYFKLGNLFQLPVMVDKRVSEYPYAIDRIESITPSYFPSRSKQYYENILSSLKPGITVLLLHVAYDNDEMKAITAGHPLWGSLWRQNDFNFFTSKEAADLLKANDIKLINWREIRDLLRKEVKSP